MDKKGKFAKIESSNNLRIQKAYAYQNWYYINPYLHKIFSAGSIWLNLWPPWTIVHGIVHGLGGKFGQTLKKE